MTLETGSVVGGRYTLVQPLDRGGMGTVWEARDSSGGVLAIKFLSYSVGHPAALRRFRREAKALERLDHPNVVRMVAHGLEDNLPFIAMERLQGQTLRRLLQGGALPPRRALAILRDAASGPKVSRSSTWEAVTARSIASSECSTWCCASALGCASAGSS